MITAADIETAFAKATFTTGPRLRLYRDLTAAMRHGTHLHDALDDLADRGGRPSRAAREWRRRLLRGASLSHSMRGWVPEVDRSMVAAGENNGDALGGLLHARFLAEGQRQVWSALLAEIATPAIGAVLLTALMLLLISGWS